MAQKTAVVVGGGITGLTAAYYLQKTAREEGRRIRIAIVEQESSLGGKVATLRRDGFVIERGPDSFLARKWPIIELARELGLEEELVPTNPQAKKTFILHRGRLHRMPEGLSLGIPTQWAPFLKTGLLTPAGKLRAAMDWFLPARKEEGDESLGHFLERRLGAEVLERIVEPLLAGIHAGDVRQLSVLATFPQFRELERRYGSLIRGMMATSAAGRAAAGRATNTPPAALPERVRGSVFLSFRHGLYTLIEALAEQLREAEFLLGARVDSIRPADSSDGHRYELRMSDGRQLAADAVVLAVPAFALADMFPELDAVRAFGRMPYASVANVVLAFRRADVEQPEGSGFVVTRGEKRMITACTWTSAKWGHTAPKDRVLIRCYVGRMGEESWTQMSDEQLVEGVMRDVRETTGISADPVLVDVNRHYRAMPQYVVGHLQSAAAAREQLAAAYPGVLAAGSAFYGVGLPDCVRQGKEAAAEAGRWLR